MNTKRRLKRKRTTKKMACIDINYVNDTENVCIRERVEEEIRRPDGTTIRRTITREYEIKRRKSRVNTKVVIAVATLIVGGVTAGIAYYLTSRSKR